MHNETLQDVYRPNFTTLTLRDACVGGASVMRNWSVMWSTSPAPGARCSVATTFAPPGSSEVGTRTPVRACHASGRGKASPGHIALV